MKLFIAVLFVFMAKMAVANHKCSGDGATMWQFNGERHETTKMPCKYNAVRQRCGPYDINLTPGNIYRQPRFRLDSLWLGISEADKDGESLWEGRTDNKVSVKYYKEWKDVLFNQKGGTLNTSQILKFGKDATSTWAEDLDGYFKVTFVPWDPDNINFPRSQWSFECFDEDFVAMSYPTQLCGGEDTQEVAARRELLDLDHRDEVIYFDVFNNTAIVQMNPKCEAAVDIMTQDCTEDEQRDAIKTCSEILSNTKHTKCVTKYSCDPMDIFLSCMTWVCSNYTNQEACEEVGHSIDLCRSFSQGGLTEKVENAHCFTDYLHIDDDD